MTKPTLCIVVWDTIGNVLLGVRMGASLRERLRPDDPAALEAAPGFDELFADYDVTLHECKSLSEVERHIADADFLVIHKQILPGDVLKRGTKLRLIQHLGLDHRGVPLDTARAMGIPCAATPLVNYLAVAEHNWALILNHLKRLPQQRTHMEQRAQIRNRWADLAPFGIALACDLTLGLLGLGEIARPMARYAQAFGMRVIYWDRQRFHDLEQRYGIDYVEWDALWRQSDVLSVQIPIKPETHKIIGAREIGLMKPKALFVNTARGKLVDQEALITALRERRIGGAALDVLYNEPPPPDDPMLDLHEDLSYNVTLTPHSAWQGCWTYVRDSLGIWNNVLHVLRGEPVDHRIG